MPQANLQRTSDGCLHVSGTKKAGNAKLDEQISEASVRQVSRWPIDGSVGSLKGEVGKKRLGQTIPFPAATASSRMVPTSLKKTVAFNKPFLFIIRNRRFVHG